MHQLVNEHCQVETLGCLHPCSGKRLPAAALFGFNCNEKWTYAAVQLGHYMVMYEYCTFMCIPTLPVLKQTFKTNLFPSVLINMSQENIFCFSVYHCQKNFPQVRKPSITVSQINQKNNAERKFAAYSFVKKKNCNHS